MGRLSDELEGQGVAIRVRVVCQRTAAAEGDEPSSKPLEPESPGPRGSGRTCRVRRPRSPGGPDRRRLPAACWRPGPDRVSRPPRRPAPPGPRERVACILPGGDRHADRIGVSIGDHGVCLPWASGPNDSREWPTSREPPAPPPATLGAVPSRSGSGTARRTRSADARDRGRAAARLELGRRRRGRDAGAGARPREPRGGARPRRAHARRACRVRDAHRRRALRRRRVVPYAVGVDIGCGVALARTDLVWGGTLTPASSRRPPPDRAGHADRLRRPSPTADDRGPDGRADRRGCAGFDRARWLERAAVSLGTLGRREPLPRGPARRRRRVHFMLHSGSRNLGKQVCDEFVRRARIACSRPGACRTATSPTSASARTRTRPRTGRRWSGPWRGRRSTGA